MARVSSISSQWPEGSSQRCFSLLSEVPMRSSNPFAEALKWLTSKDSYLIEELPELTTMTLMQDLLWIEPEWP